MVLHPLCAWTANIMLTACASCALTAPTRRLPDVVWRQTGNTSRTTGADRHLRPTGGISLIPVPWSCVQMATTIQVEAVGYFRMVGTLALNDRYSLTFRSYEMRCKR